MHASGIKESNLTFADFYCKITYKYCITQSRYDVFRDSDENDTKGCNNDNGELSNNVTASILSQEVNLGNSDKRKDQQKHKSRQKERNEKSRSVTVVVRDSIVKKVKGWELSTKGN